jgi:hypothetical protein
LLKSRGTKAFDGFTDFSFETIPDGLTQMEGNGDDAKQDLSSLRQSVRKNFIYPFRELLAKLHVSAESGLIPHVTCLVSDSMMSFTIQIAEELALPVALLIPYSACSFLSILHTPALIERGLIPLKGNNFVLFSLLTEVCVCACARVCMNCECVYIFKSLTVVIMICR